MRTIKKTIKKCLDLCKSVLVFFFRLLPIRKKRIYFISNFGKKYSCNTKAYFEYLKENHGEEFEFYYCFHKKNKIEGAKSAPYMSLKDLYYLSTSKIIVNNFRFHKYFKKRKSQIYIQTWHGTTIPYKAVEAAVESSLSKKYVKEAKNDGKYIDILTCGSVVLSKFLKEYFWNNGKITNFGTPRCDVLINATEKDIKKAKQVVGVPEGKKLLVFAPTFKNNKTIQDEMVDSLKFIKLFKEKLNEDIIIGYRFHPNLADQVKDIKFENSINLTDVSDVNDVVLASDYLVSDYSSIIFDGVFARKKCFSYAKDYDEYIKNERNLWIDYNNFPFRICKTEEELIEEFLKSKEYDTDVVLERIKIKFGTTEEGHACDSLYNEMMSIINKEG